MTVRPCLAAALLVPALALAAAEGGKPSQRPAGRSAAARPKPAAASTDASPGGPEVGGFIGYETADFSGLSLRVDGALPLRELPRKVTLSVVGSLGYSRLTWRPGYGVEGTANVLKVVPAARFTLPVASTVSLFGDAGLGLAYVSTRVDLPASFAAADIRDSTFNLMLRVGLGAWYHATDRLDLGVLVELDPIFGDFGFKSAAGVSAGSQTTFLAQAGAQYRL
jgi:hypothetical protein